MSLADLIRGTLIRSPEGLATVTHATPATEGPQIAPCVADVAPVTVAMPAEGEPSDPPGCLWELHFTNLDPLAVVFSPAVDHAGALAAYPQAIAAVPMQAPSAALIPSDLTAMFNACAQLGLYDESDRSALPTMFAGDAKGTRELIEAMHARIGRCRRCRHFGRPGLSDGYCTDRNDLPVVYGVMRGRPADGGTLCRFFDDLDRP